MNKTKNIIFLSGFMGSGKSTIGPRLAKKLGYDFVDIDDVIEKRNGISIASIFTKHGERHFRNMEKQILDEILSGKERIVVALGGGTLTRKESRELIKKGGVLIYLKTDPDVILDRVGRGKTDRPMLLAPDGSRLSGRELSIKIRSLLTEREGHYLEAGIVIDTSLKGVSGVVEEITSKLGGEIL